MTIPTLPQPMIPEPPDPPKVELPELTVITPKDVQYFADACDAYEAVGQEDAAKLQEVQAEYSGLSREDACGWAIYGFNVQSWLTVESQIAELTGYVVQLQAHIRFLEEQMLSRQRIVEEQLSAIEKIGPVSQPAEQP